MASSRALDLRWSAPEGCPEAAAVQARLDNLLGPNRAPGTQATLKVEAHRSTFKLTLKLDGDGVRGSRELTGSDCAALAETGAWLVAVAIDPGLSLSPPPPPAPEPATEPTAEAAPAAPEPAKPATPKPATSTGSDWALHAALFGGVLHAIERPVVQGDLGLALGASYRWLSAELRATVALPSDVRAGSTSANVSNQSLGLAVCGLWGDWLRAGPCATFALFRTRAEAASLPNDNGPELAYWGQVLLGAQAAVRLAWPIELFLEGGAGTAVSPRPAYRVGDESGNRPRELAAGRLTGYGRLGFRFRWPIAREARR